MNAWNHIAVTISGNTGTLYINGVVAGGNGNLTLKPSSLGSTTQNYLGRSQFPDPYFNGLLDEFQIRNRALTATEVAALATPPNAPTGLAATGGAYQVSLVWNPVAGVTGYSLKRSTVAGGPYTTIAADLVTTSYTDTSLTAGTTYCYIVTAQKLVAESALSAQASTTVLTPSQVWRLTYFGTAANTGIAADNFDANGDGELNLLEFATAQNPNAGTTATPTLFRNGANLEFTYTRSDAALADAVAFTVEWRDDLTTGAWSSAGVTEQILTDNGTVQTVRATVAAGSGPRFVRLRVTK